MSYFIYLQPSNSSVNYCQEDLYNLTPFQTDASSQSLYFQQEFYISSTFRSPQLNFIEFPQQIDSNAQNFTPFEDKQQIELQTKEHKKREKNFHKEIQSAKKNSQSNLINHFFSLFSNRDKSEKALDGCICSLSKKDSHKEKLFHLFYNAIHVINAKRGRKYVNRKILTDLFDPEQLLKAVPEIKQKIEKINDVTIEQLCQIFRKCCCFFFRTYSINSILTSKRISSFAKEEHLKKRRKISEAFFSKE